MILLSLCPFLPLKVIPPVNPIQFSAAKTELTYEAGIYNFMDKLQLTLNGWGYEEILVQTDVPFLKPDQTN